MFYNYLKIAFRSLWKNGLFSAINIFGLALSMSVCLIALLVIKDAFTYDTLHPHPERTYRIITQPASEGGNKERWATTPLPLAEKLEADYSLIEAATRVYPALSDQLVYDSKSIGIEGAFTGPSFFTVFGFEMLFGDKTSVLQNPYSIVLTQSTAELFFKKENPVGKTVYCKNLGVSFTITGVLKDNGEKTHLSSDAYASMATVPLLEAANKLDASSQDWKSYNASGTYILLKENASESDLQNALNKIASTTKGIDKNKHPITYDLQNIGSITPGEELINGGNTVSATVLLAVSGIAFLILLLACFNYTNLSLARSLTRAKEVGIRKVAGSSRTQLFLQFITESIVVALFALALASVMLHLLLQLPTVATGILQNAKPDAIVWALFLLFAIVTGTLAGIMPAWILSSFKPVEVIKNLATVKLFKGLGLQKTLIVIQFTVSLVFVIFLSTIYFQNRHLSTFTYGFNIENIVNIALPDKGKELFKNEIVRLAGVQKAAATSALFGSHPGSNTQIKFNKSDERLVADNFFIDADFIPLMGLQILAGSNFDQSTERGTGAVVLNEYAVKSAGFKSPSDAVGRQVYIDDTTIAIVAGVVKDFNYFNPRHPIANLTLVYAPERCQYLSLSVLPQSSNKVLLNTEALFKNLDAAAPFSYTWLDKELKSTVDKGEDFSIIAFLSLMAITIACIGLLGIATYTARIRQKEVGIRKVMGASVQAIVILLSKDFIKLLLLSAAFALPIGYLLSSNFLLEFAYRITVGWKILTISLLLILVLGLITICSQTLKAAIANPIKHLRSE